MSFNSINNIISNAQTYGAINRCISCTKAPFTTTAATTACGGIITQRIPTSFNIFGGTSSSPSLGGGVTGGYITQFRTHIPSGGNPCVFGVEFTMGTVTANGGTGTFSDGAALPTRTIVNANNASVTIAPLMIFATVTTAMAGAGTYTLTITYTNQDGTSGRTATLTIPTTAAAYSAFDVVPHLQGDDTSMSDITGITCTGTTGVIQINGFFPIAWTNGGTVDDYNVITDPLTTTLPFFKILNTDVLALYRFGSTSAFEQLIYYTVVPEI